MRARLWALLILIGLLAIPAGLYWYFFHTQIASITLSVPGEVPYHVLLVGTLDNESLPLVDKLIKIEKNCLGVCVFSPLAPIRYSITLTSTGKTTITDNVSLSTAEARILEYALQSDIGIKPLDAVLVGNIDIGAALLGNATKKDPDFNYTLIGVDREGLVYAERSTSGMRELGTLSLEKFSPLWSIPKGVGKITIDITGEYFLSPLFANKTLVLSRDLVKQREIPFTGVVGYSEESTNQKILTNSGIITSWQGSYGENPRFTDWLDITSTERLGYISGDDRERLLLSNISSGESVLILLDRETGQSQILKKGLDIWFLFFFQGMPVFLDHEGKLWKIEIGDRDSK